MSAHANCTHPATKAARAKCRAARKAAEITERENRAEIIQAYYDGAELDEIFGMMAQRGIYIDPDKDIDEILESL